MCSSQVTCPLSLPVLTLTSLGLVFGEPCKTHGEKDVWDVTDGRYGGAERTVWETLLEMQRFSYHAGEREQGAVALVLDFVKAFDAVSIFPGRFCVCSAYSSSTSGEYSSKDLWRSRSRPSRPFSLGQSGVACSCALCCRTH